MKGWSEYCLLIPLIFGGCDFTAKVHPEFVPHVRAFEKLTGIKYQGSMVFVKEPITEGGVAKPEIAGQCEYHAKDIVISVTHWNLYGPAQREALIFHELGHCAAGLRHNPVVRLPSTCPDSIMYPKVVGEECYQNYRLRYYQQLVTAIKTEKKLPGFNHAPH